MDELKELWNKEQGDRPILKDQKVDFSNSTESIVDKMKKALYWEDIFNKVITVAFIGFFIYKEDYFFSIGFFMLMIPIIWYYKYLMDEMAKITYQAEVKSYLKSLYHLLRTFIIRYRVIGIIIVPVSFIYGFYVGYNESPEADKVIKPLTILLGVLAMLGFYGFAELYIYLLYGRKLQKLKELIKEMNSK